MNWTKVFLSAGISLTLLFPSSFSKAQIQKDTIDLQEVIINESRLQIPFKSQNRNLTIITREEIAALPAQSLNEVLSYVGGVDLRQRGPLGAQADVSIDGGTFEQLTVLLNGIRMNDSQSGHNTLNLPVPVSAIERIEVLRGSAARIYGINSLTGAINIVTVQSRHNDLKIQASKGTNFKENQEKNNRKYYADLFEIAGSLADETQNHLWAASLQKSTGHRYNTANKNHKIFYQGNVSTSHTQTFSFTAGYVYNKFGANGYYAAPVDKEALEITQSALLSAAHKAKIGDRITLHSKLNYRYSYDDYRLYRTDLNTARNQHYTHTYNPEINARISTKQGEIGVGIDARFEKINSSNIGNHNRENLGFFIEYRTAPFPQTELSLGSYVNFNSTFGWKVYPGLDFGYHLTDHWKLYLNSGTGQRLPSFTDLYYDTPTNIGNPGIQPEKAWYAETGVKYANQHLQVTASGFYRKVDEFIDWVRNSSQDPWRAFNFLEHEVKGISINADLAVPGNSHWQTRIGISYTYLEASLDKKNEGFTLSKYALESLKHQLVGRVSTAYKAFQLTVMERFQERVNQKNYFLTDAKLQYTYGKYALHIKGTNLFDRKYTEVGAIPMPGRWYTGGVLISL